MAPRGLAETPDLELLHREGLHDADAADGLFQQRGHVGHPLLQPVRGGP